jgi:hypothetical protein
MRTTCAASSSRAAGAGQRHPGGAIALSAPDPDDMRSRSTNAWSDFTDHVLAPAASFVYHEVIQPAARAVNRYVVRPLVHAAVATCQAVRDA